MHLIVQRSNGDLTPFFGRTPKGWLRLQLQYDLWKAKQNVDIAHLERVAA